MGHMIDSMTGSRLDDARKDTIITSVSVGVAACLSAL